MREPRHPGIEAYLAALDAGMGALSPDRRAAERSEIAHHLELLVTAHRARGLSADDAVRAAVRRIGSADALGAALASAGRARRPPVRDALEFTFIWTLPVLARALSGWYVDGVPFPHPWIDSLFMAVVVTLTFSPHRRSERRTEEVR